MSLYNIKSAEDHFVITKFDDDLNVESSYPYYEGHEGAVCHCPAGQRPTCRHRQMFPQLVDRVDTAWFLDFDTRAWEDPTGEARATQDLGLPEGVSAYSLDDPVVVHNAIAKALDEPETMLKLNKRVKQDIEEGHQATIRREPLPESHPFRRF